MKYRAVVQSISHDHHPIPDAILIAVRRIDFSVVSASFSVFKEDNS